MSRPRSTLRHVVGDDAPLRNLVAAIHKIAATRTGAVFVALDGRSGAGKSTLAAQARNTLEDCVVIVGDDFYAGGSDEYWDASSPADKAAHGMDWRRQRRTLQALAAGDAAHWHGYDWTRSTDGWRRPPRPVHQPRS
jgi:uridine kinase